jgi:cytochrome P450/NADPH-cytochrome P450 reductase
MDTRFNSFYKDEQDPFVEAIRTILVEAQVRSSRPAFLRSFMWASNQTFDDANAYIHQVAAEVITKRRANAPNAGKNDLLNAMLNRRDPLTGKKLDDKVVIDNMITFLIAGKSTPINM